MSNIEQGALFATEITHVGTDPTQGRRKETYEAGEHFPPLATETDDTFKERYQDTADYALAETLRALSRGRSAHSLGEYAVLGNTTARQNLKAHAQAKGITTQKALRRVEGTAHDERRGIAAMHHKEWLSRLDPSGERHSELPALEDIERQYYGSPDADRERQRILARHRRQLEKTQQLRAS